MQKALSGSLMDDAKKIDLMLNLHKLSRFALNKEYATKIKTCMKSAGV